MVGRGGKAMIVAVALVGSGVALATIPASSQTIEEQEARTMAAIRALQADTAAAKRRGAELDRRNAVLDRRNAELDQIIVCKKSILAAMNGGLKLSVPEAQDAMKDACRYVKAHGLPVSKAE